MLNKIKHADYRRMIERFSENFSAAETALLNEILTRFEFDPVQEQALVQAVMQQSRFDPNTGHWDSGDARHQPARPAAARLSDVARTLNARVFQAA